MTPTNPIPPNVVAHICGTNDSDARHYALWKDGRVLVVQANPLKDPNDGRYGHETFDFGAMIKHQMDYSYGLEVIHTLIESLDFEQSNWAYLISGPDGYHIQQKEKPMYKMDIPIWAPLIEESEITYTDFRLGHERVGYWKGQEVEVLVGWEDYWLKYIERATRGHKHLLGMDLTYEVLGHLVRNGEVIGLVTEPAIGRVIQYCDRSLVYEAMSRLERLRLIYMGFNFANLLVSNGKLRLIHPAALWHYTEDQETEFREKSAYRHWDCVDAEFKSMPRNFVYRQHLLRDMTGPSCCLLPKHPSPEFPISIQIPLSYSNLIYPWRKLYRKDRKGHRHSLRFAEDDSSSESRITECDIGFIEPVTPHANTTVSRRHRSNVGGVRVSWPYSLEKPPARRLLLGPKDNDAVDSSK